MVAIARTRFCVRRVHMYTIRLQVASPKNNLTIHSLSSLLATVVVAAARADTSRRMSSQLQWVTVTEEIKTIFIRSLPNLQLEC